MPGGSSALPLSKLRAVLDSFDAGHKRSAFLLLGLDPRFNSRTQVFSRA
jgi:hypothetical protein